MQTETIGKGGRGVLLAYDPQAVVTSIIKSTVLLAAAAAAAAGSYSAVIHESVPL